MSLVYLFPASNFLTFVRSTYQILLSLLLDLVERHFSAPLRAKVLVLKTACPLAQAEQLSQLSWRRVWLSLQKTDLKTSCWNFSASQVKVLG